MAFDGRINTSDPFRIIEMILDELDCNNHFTRSRIFIAANKALGESQMTLEELALFLRFHGPDEFCDRFGKQEELPTRPGTPSALEQGRLAEQSGDPASDSKNGLLSQIQTITGNVSMALKSGSSTTLPAIKDQASAAPSSRRWPKGQP
jgi:hypothetical protein